MNKSFFSFLLLLGLVCLPAMAQELDSIPAGPESLARRQTAEKIAGDFFAKNGQKALDMEDDAITAALLDEFSARAALRATPVGELKSIKECEVQAAKNRAAEIEKRYPILTQKELEKLAVEKYPLYQPKEKITVNYFNRNAPTSVTGVYYGTQGAYVRVGSARIHLDDVARLEGNEEEVLKLDPRATGELREKYQRDLSVKTITSRQNYEKDNREKFLKEAIREAGIANEAAGYIFLDGEWYSPKDALAIIVGKQREAYVADQQAKETLRQMRQVAALDAQFKGVVTRAQLTPVNARINPEEVLKAQQLAAQKAAEEKAAAEEAEAERKRAEAQAAAEREEQARQKKLAAERAAQQKLEQENAPEVQVNHLARNLIIGLVALFVLGIVIFFIWHQIKVKRDKEIFTKFFEGEGQVQKDFWGKADADPEHFKYVAYMFPGLKEATEALTHLTYISTGGNGQLKCSKPLEFGVYPHQNGAVAFVGGSKFHYAPWREATAVLPELPGAVYFKVSTEPEVLLDLPAAEEGLPIENLGYEDIEDNNGAGFARCYKYRTDNREHAIAFLEKFNVNEEGIIIHVETPDGVFGKDENGIFTV
ncbi:MAG: hypothetical protein IJJ26_08025 [Victivallales bacterium]|nr:hypothetical protein [Victivallales bacterium]